MIIILIKTRKIIYRYICNKKKTITITIFRLYTQIT